MNTLDYQYRTIESEAIESLYAYDQGRERGRVRFFALALIELVYDPAQEEFYLIACDATTADYSRCWPAPDPLEDWFALTGIEPTSEMKGKVMCIQDGWA